MITFKPELKCSNKRTAGIGKYGQPGRVWVRGYNEDGLRVYSEHVAFVDKRYTGPGSDCGRQLIRASIRASDLQTKNNVKNLEEDI